MAAEKEKPAAETKPGETKKQESSSGASPSQAAAPTPEEVQQDAQAFIEANFGSGAAKELVEPPKKEVAAKEPSKEEKAAEEKPVKEEKTEQEPTEKAEKEKEADKKRFTPAKKAATAEEIEAIARRAAREEADEREKSVEKPPARETEQPVRDEDLNLTEENRETLDVISEMETLNPEKYKELGKNVRRFWKMEEQRIEKWKAEHPDEPYDPQATEHQEFYRRHEPNYSQRDFNQASRARIEKAAEERAVKRVQSEYEPKFKAIEAERLERQVKPKIDAAVADAVESVFKAAPEFEKLVEPGKMTEETVKKMAEINPALHDYATEEAEEVMAVVEEIEKLTHLNGHYKFDASKEVQLESSGKLIYPHATINRGFAVLESEMMKKPPAERLDGGREFITNREYNAKQQEILKSALTSDAKERQLQKLAETTWRWTPEDVRNFIVKQSGNRVAARAKKYANFSKAPAAEARAEGGQTQKAAEVEKPSAKAGLPKGTATSSVSDTADNAPKDKTAQQKEDEEFVRANFS